MLYRSIKVQTDRQTVLFNNINVLEMGHNPALDLP